MEKRQRKRTRFWCRGSVLTSCSTTDWTPATRGTSKKGTAGQAESNRPMILRSSEREWRFQWCCYWRADACCLPNFALAGAFARLGDGSERVTEAMEKTEKLAEARVHGGRQQWPTPLTPGALAVRRFSPDTWRPEWSPGSSVPGRPQLECWIRSLGSPDQKWHHISHQRVGMKTDGNIRLFFYIYPIFVTMWKWDGEIRERDEGDRERDGKRLRVYPTRTCGIPFLTGMIPYSFHFLHRRDSPNYTVMHFLWSKISAHPALSSLTADGRPALQPAHARAAGRSAGRRRLMRPCAASATCEYVMSILISKASWYEFWFFYTATASAFYMLACCSAACLRHCQGRLYNFEGPWASKKIRVYSNNF
jgi:hypothetical protein